MKLVLKLIASAVILAAAGLAIYQYSWLPWRCNLVAMDVDIRTRQTQRAYSPMVIKPAARESLRMLAPCLEHVPSNVVCHSLAGYNYRLLEEHEKAAEAFANALRYDRRPELHFAYGRELFEMGQREKGKEELMRAGVIRPDLLSRLPVDLQNELLNRVYLIRKGS